MYYVEPTETKMSKVEVIKYIHTYLLHKVPSYIILGSYLEYNLK